MPAKNTNKAEKWAKLTDTKCRNAGEGKHADGGGLYLHVTAKGRYWRAAYRFDGKQKTASFGVYPAVTLKDARLAHAAFKAQLKRRHRPQRPQEGSERLRPRKTPAWQNGTSLHIFANLSRPTG